MTADGFASGLPTSVEEHLRRIERDGGIQRVHSHYDELVEALQNEESKDDDNDDDDDDDMNEKECS